MKIALCQFDMAWEDRAANRAKIENMVEACPQKDNLDWLVFPEMALSGFTMSVDKAAADETDTRFFSALARKRGMYVSYGAVEDGRNKLVTVNRRGERINGYSKIHLYAFGQEDKYYTAGTKQETFDLEGFNVTPAVCFDLRFPYLFWNTAEKTDVYVVIASWPARRAEHWMTLLRARAVENQCYCIGVNRTGKDPILEYSGNSMIFDPLGKVVLDCKSAEGVTAAEIDVTKELVTKTRTRFPFLKERKPDAVFA